MSEEPNAIGSEILSIIGEVVQSLIVMHDGRPRKFILRTSSAAVSVSMDSDAPSIEVFDLRQGQEGVARLNDAISSRRDLAWLASLHVEDRTNDRLDDAEAQRRGNPLRGRDRHERIRFLFHKLWSDASGTKTYSKKHWSELQVLLEDIGVRV